MTDPTVKFIGKAVVLDPDTGAPTDYACYICLLLTGAERQPSIIVGDAPTLAELMAKLERDDLYARFRAAPLTFDPPPGEFPINQSGAQQRFEALALDEIYRFRASRAA